MDLILGELDAVALKSLRWHWGSAYHITGGGSAWYAVSRKAPVVMLTAATAPELRDLIRADYLGRTSTRQVVSGRTTRDYPPVT